MNDLFHIKENFILFLGVVVWIWETYDLRRKQQTTTRFRGFSKKAAFLGIF